MLKHPLLNPPQAHEETMGPHSAGTNVHPPQGHDESMAPPAGITRPYIWRSVHLYIDIRIIHRFNCPVQRLSLFQQLKERLEPDVPGTTLVNDGSIFAGLALW